MGARKLIQAESSLTSRSNKARFTCSGARPIRRPSNFARHRWGLHNLRHSLSIWLVNKAKENPKTVQGILGYSRIQTTLDLYTEEDLDEMIAAQDKFIDAVGFERETVQ